jgi:dTDP-4-dehydrorhamnose reductase
MSPSLKILLLGGHGRVGWELQRSLAPLGHLVALGREQADLTWHEQVLAAVRTVAPQLIVNAAAYTAVDRAESEPGLAHAVNATAVAVLAAEAANRGAWLLHYSTDYVFNGSGLSAWHEDAPTEPLNVYGRSKLEGELAIRASGCKHLILRTSWIHSPRGTSFARSMLRLAAGHAPIRVIDDQVGAPTSAELLADVSAHVLRRALPEPALAGTYHVAAEGETSWHGYACHVLAVAQRLGLALRTQPDQLLKVPAAAYPAPARRPLNCRLDTRKLKQTFAVHLPDWRVGVDRLLSELQPQHV